MRKGAQQSFLFSLRAINHKAPSKFDSVIDFTIPTNDSKLEKPLEDNVIEVENDGSRLPQFCPGGDWRIRGFYQSAYEVDIVSNSLSSRGKVEKVSSISWEPELSNHLGRLLYLFLELDVSPPSLNLLPSLQRKLFWLFESKVHLI